jgi:hypothetical protein
MSLGMMSVGDSRGRSSALNPIYLALLLNFPLWEFTCFGVPDRHYLPFAVFEPNVFVVEV